MRGSQAEAHFRTLFCCLCGSSVFFNAAADEMCIIYGKQLGGAYLIEVLLARFRLWRALFHNCAFNYIQAHIYTYMHALSRVP
jgi:hypothetical protein